MPLGPGSIAAPLLPIEPALEGFSSLLMIVMKLNLALAGLANPAPLPDQRRPAEQTELNRKHVVASHVAAGIAPIKNQVLNGL